jgi:hypothetical protein
MFKALLATTLLVSATVGALAQTHSAAEQQKSRKPALLTYRAIAAQ